MNTFNSELASFTRGSVTVFVVVIMTLTTGFVTGAMYTKWVDPQPLVLGAILFLPVAVFLIVRFGLAMKKFSCPVCQKEDTYKRIAVRNFGELQKYCCPSCGGVLLFER